MDSLQIDGREIPLLEAPERYEDPPRRILYVLFKHKLMICVIFILLIVIFLSQDQHKKGIKS